MATKKSGTPVPEEPVNEEEKLEQEAQKSQQMANMKAELEALKRENEQLRKNSVAASGAAGARSDYERVQDACKKAAEEGVDAWDVKISVRAPRRPAKEDPFYWFNINGKTIQIPATDRYYDLQLPFAAALVDLIHAEWFASDYIDSIEEYDPVTNPHRE